MFHAEYYRQKEKQEALIARKNTPSDFYNGIYTRWTNPVLTRSITTNRANLLNSSSEIMGTPDERSVALWN